MITNETLIVSSQKHTRENPPRQYYILPLGCVLVIFQLAVVSFSFSFYSYKFSRLTILFVKSSVNDFNFYEWVMNVHETLMVSEENKSLVYSSWQYSMLPSSCLTFGYACQWNNWRCHWRMHIQYLLFSYIFAGVKILFVKSSVNDRFFLSFLWNYSLLFFDSLFLIKPCKYKGDREVKK